MCARLTAILLVLQLSLLAPQALAGVDGADYDAFWLWSGTRSQSLLSRANILYLHQGEILARPSGARFIKLGRSPTPLFGKRLWLVVRVNALPLSAKHEKMLERLYRAWLNQGARVIGIQIDFDAATHRLDRYGHALTRLRQVLPKACRLSVTGLLDWAKTGDIAQLNRLPVDELVIQTYQGTQTVNDYEAYLPAMAHLTLPFKVGLVQGGQWDRRWQRRLAASPYYRGEVVFLLNPPRPSS